MKKQYIILILFILFVSTSFAKQKENEKTVIQSNKVDKVNSSTIRAIGDVEVKKGNKIFNANEVEYNQNTKTIKANSEVRVYDIEENTIYFSETAETTDDFNKADFRNGVVVFENGSTISSNYIQKLSESDIIMNKAKYYVCPTKIFSDNLTYEQIMEYLEKKKYPLFSLRSSKINADNVEKKLSLWSTSVWIWKIPIFYLPYLKTSMVYKKEANGFQMPGLESTKHYGYGIYLPYRIITERQNIKITPKIYQEGNYLLNLKYSIASLNENKWKINLKSDLTNDNGESKKLTNAYGVTEEEEEGKYKQWRGYVSSSGYYNFNDYWTFDYGAAVFSDRYYYRDYYQSGESYIKSDFKFTRINMKKIYDFNYFQFSNLFYQELLEKNNNYNAPKYAPVTNTHLQNTIFKNDASVLFYKIKLNTTNLFRKVGVEYNRITILPGMYNTLNTNIGTFNTNLELQTDTYVLNEVGYKPGIYDDDESRMLLKFNTEWRKSFASQNFSIQPIIKYSISTNQRSFEKYVPNEDSEAQSLSFENIFSNNRFIGYDRQEFGNRITYGFESTLFNNLNFGLAQGYREYTDTENGKNLIGFEEHLSDYVGYISYVFNEHFDINYRFLTDKDDFYFKKNEVTLNFDINRFNIYMIYTDLKENMVYTDRAQQINFGLIVRLFNNNWKISLSGISDLQNDNRLMQSSASLRYDGNCTRWEIIYTDYNPLTETNKNTTVSFSLTVKFI